MGGKNSRDTYMLAKLGFLYTEVRYLQYGNTPNFGGQERPCPNLLDLTGLVTMPTVKWLESSL